MTANPMLRLLPTRSCRAASLRTYCSSRIAARTRAAVSAETRPRPLRTFDTVAGDTFAAAATSLTLACPFILHRLHWLRTGNTIHRREKPDLTAFHQLCDHRFW